MTAVASPQSFEPIHTWDNGSHAGASLELNSSSDLEQLRPPNKSLRRPSPSSIASAPFAMDDINVSEHMNSEFVPASNDQTGWGAAKKTNKFWPPPNTSDVGNALANLTLSNSSHVSSPQSLKTNSTSVTQLQTPHSQINGVRSTDVQHSTRTEPSALLALQPITNTFQRKHIPVPLYPEVQKIGRQTNNKTVPAATNGYFDSKVLSRQHAEIWSDRSGRVWIKDVKSSNGTFVNGVRLSQENKESEPHELREGDQLELGIDIVTEDQKSILHHKVSAKVEFAGFYNAMPNFLDGMQVDPSTGQPMLNDSANLQNNQFVNGRASMAVGHGSSRTNQVAGSVPTNYGRLGPNAHLNMWMGSITVEQVVKKLNIELKNARRQSQDLHHTGEYFNALLNMKPAEAAAATLAQGEGQENVASDSRQTRGLSNVEASPIPASPAPGPTHFSPVDLNQENGPTSFGPHVLLQRSNTEKVGIQMDIAPGEIPEGGQIISLLEALKAARHEISTQGDRMQYLETALVRERKAREFAEQRARSMNGEHTKLGDLSTNNITDKGEGESLTLPDNHCDFVLSDEFQQWDEHEVNHPLVASASVETLRDLSSPNMQHELLAVSLDDRYLKLKEELETAKTLMENISRRRRKPRPVDFTLHL